MKHREKSNRKRSSNKSNFDAEATGGEFSKNSQQSQNDVVIGSIFAVVLGSAALFLARQGEFSVNCVMALKNVLCLEGF